MLIGSPERVRAPLASTVGDDGDTAELAFRLGPVAELSSPGGPDLCGFRVLRVSTRAARADRVRSGVQLAPIEIDPRFQVRAADSAYARTALPAGVLDVIASFGQAGHRVDLSVEGQQLVAVSAPKDPDQLQAYLEGLARIAQALQSSSLAPYRTPPRPPGFGFYGHPDWQLIGRDDALIAKYGLTTAGFGHTTEKVIRGSNDGLPIEAFIHD
jgi:hypothetical protein